MDRYKKIYLLNSYLLQFIGIHESRIHSYRVYSLTASSILTAFGAVLFINILNGYLAEYETLLIITFFILFVVNISVIFSSIRLVTKATNDSLFFQNILIKNEKRILSYNLRYFIRYKKKLSKERFFTNRWLNNLNKDEENSESFEKNYPFRARNLGNYILFSIIFVWIIMIYILFSNFKLCFIREIFIWSIKYFINCKSQAPSVQYVLSGPPI